MASSVQAVAINKTLKFIVKPLVRQIPINSRTKRIAQPAFDTLTLFNIIPRNVNVEHFNIDHIPAEFITAGVTKPERLMIYFHGGGYFFGSAQSHRGLTWRLSRAGRTKVLAINYRQHPQHEHPAPIIDAVTSYRWALENGYEAKNIVFAGDSAGGNLTLTAMLKLKELGIELPGGAICISPWADLSNSMDSLKDNARRDAMIPPRTLKAVAKAYVGDNDPQDPLLSPIYGDFSDFPPMLVYVGTTELLRDAAKAVADKAEEAGVQVQYKEWKDLFHVFPLAASILPEGKDAIRGIKYFLTTDVYSDYLKEK